MYLCESPARAESADGERLQKHDLRLEDEEQAVSLCHETGASGAARVLQRARSQTAERETGVRTSAAIVEANGMWEGSRLLPVRRPRTVICGDLFCGACVLCC